METNEIINASKKDIYAKEPQKIQTTAGQDLLMIADRVMDLADTLNVQAEKKLSPIMSESMPNENSCQDPIAQWPDYFDLLRARFFDIEQSLLKLADCIDRVDL